METIEVYAHAFPAPTILGRFDNIPRLVAVEWEMCRIWPPLARTVRRAVIEALGEMSWHYGHVATWRIRR